MLLWRRLIHSISLAYSKGFANDDSLVGVLQLGVVVDILFHELVVVL